MVNVSNDFLEVMQQPAQRRRCYGTIGNVSFSNRNIIQGSTSITNQCSGGTDIAIGQVYIGELKITLRGLSIPRRGYKDKEIILYQGLLIDEENGIWEDVCLGHFFVDKADWTMSGVSITAYDAMYKLDKDMTYTLSSGRMYDFVSIACTVCGVVLGMTSTDFAWLPNGLSQFYLYDENDIETWRDVISWCAQTMGCNATINREGKLVFLRYGQTVVDVYGTKRRLSGGSFSDFESYYTGLSVVNMAAQTTSYYGLEQDTGLTMNLGSNPFLQYGTASTQEVERRAILNAIAEINYTPATVSLNALMIYDLMDVLGFTDGIVGDGAVVCITKFTWRLNGTYTIECVGSDPALTSAKSKVDKNIAGLLSMVDESKTHYYLYRNVQQYNINSGESSDIVDIRYAVKKDTYVEFHCTVEYVSETIEDDTPEQYDITNVGAVKAQYYLDDTLHDYEVYENNDDGTHLLHLLFIWKADANTQGHFKVKLSSYYTNVRILQGKCFGYLSGQGLVGEGEWDGEIIAFEELEDFDLMLIFNKAIVIDSGIVETYVERGLMPPTQNVNYIPFMSPSYLDSGQSINVSNMIFTTIVNISLLTYTATIDGITFVNGEVITPNIYGVTGIDIISIGGKYLASFDNGSTWEAYVIGTGWTTGTYMTRQEIENVPQSAWQSPVMIKAILQDEDEESLTEIILKGGSINV